MFIEVNDIKTLHLELTSYCNARCPQCARTNNPRLPLAHLSLDFIRKTFKNTNDHFFNHVYSCGNYGDPILNPEVYEICRWFLENGSKRMSLHSNGGVRDLNFWQKLGQLGVRVVFGIDGLEDTNHIYRVGVQWKKLMQNVATFIEAGGEAEWAYLIFEHNEHQIETAQKMSQELGFKKFKAKATSRFIGQAKTVENAKKQTLTESRFSSEKHSQTYEKTIDQFGSFEKYLSSTPIRCKTQIEKSIYVDFQGHVWPCCWMGHRYQKSEKYKEVVQLEDLYGKNFNNLHFHSLEKILSNPWLGGDLEKSWASEEKRLKICSVTCGKIFKPTEQVIGI